MTHFFVLFGKILLKLINYIFSGSLETCSCKSSKQCDLNNVNKKPLMVDKSLETDRHLTLEFEMDQQDVPNNNTFETNITDIKRDNLLDNLIEQKKAADMADKVK